VTDFEEDSSKKLEWEARKKSYIDRLRKEAEGALLVSAADKLYNARAILEDYREMKLIEAADKFPKRRAQYSVLFRFAYASGLRPAELFGLHVPDFDFDAGTMRVERGTFRSNEDTPKTRKGRRTIYLDDKTLDAVGTFPKGRPAGFL
jgi:integrase